MADKEKWCIFRLYNVILFKAIECDDLILKDEGLKGIEMNREGLIGKDFFFFGHCWFFLSSVERQIE